MAGKTDSDRLICLDLEYFSSFVPMQPVFKTRRDGEGRTLSMFHETDLHTKRTGHTEFVDKTLEAAKPIALEVPKAQRDDDVAMEDASTSQQPEDMVVPKVDQKLLVDLEETGFSKARATRALHYSVFLFGCIFYITDDLGRNTFEAAATWIVEHENDSDIDEMPLVPANTKAEAPKPSLTLEEMKVKAQELKEKARKKKEEEEKRMEREREKERIRVGKELLEAKRIEQDNERKRIMAMRKAEKEEEKRAREKIRQKLEEDKAERRRKLGLPLEDPANVKPVAPIVEEKKSLPIRPATKAEQMRECLRFLKQNNKDDDTKVKTAFSTLLTYLKNVASNPDEEKFRKIRLSNAAFQNRVGKVEGGIQFLELCGFSKMEGDEFLFMPRDKFDMAVLVSAGTELDNAIKNPFFGVL
ncbi:hypothetical protein RJ639_020751 [Escallonia herrerae]|uniref:PUB domain-containing protein n=1 Tax=Escallonia herrerae TaxID=1293975 RepID=A0AA88V3F7_9ASTE|nr:hypothetical protein RJ639_020751 [Escallonia herrerae]